ILWGLYVGESLSVIVQGSYFKCSKQKYGEGRRVFLMTPIHHHYQKKGLHEAKIVQRFIVIGIMLAVLTVVTLKVR
ncbi:MAG: phospho-N-acetylmuramoyl-pentapeptide-transferase, partial [Bacteroidales bacterium]|nr:phospho-N-acetylmuramoyl-pentapeptide-transferase [Bacteroidales bacterium]